MLLSHWGIYWYSVQINIYVYVYKYILRLGVREFTISLIHEFKNVTFADSCTEV